MTNNTNQHTGSIAVPRFYVWDREILHLGNQPSQPAPHRVAHDKLMVSLAGPFRIRVNGETILSSSCLMSTGQWHDQSTVDCSETVAATWLLPSFSQDVPALTRVMTRAGPGVYHSHPGERTLIDQLCHAAKTP